MVTVCYEEYINDYQRKNYTKSFYSLDGVKDWLFGMMERPCSDTFAMYFPRNKENFGRIEIDPALKKPNVWIHKMTNNDGIIFSDGKYTDGQKHISQRVFEWCQECEAYRHNRHFDFVD